eukprot:jgi/Ulvmu1/1632/UM113_0009.1
MICLWHACGINVDCSRRASSCARTFRKSAVANLFVVAIHAAFLLLKVAADSRHPCENNSRICWTDDGAVNVTTPVQFQEAVRTGVAHIVIQEHLDMRTVLRWSETTRMNSSVIAITHRADGRHTTTIRGNCNGVPSVTGPQPQPPVRIRTGQCLITVSGDFLEFSGSTRDSALWLSQMHVRTVADRGADSKQSTLVGVYGGDVYLTDMAFVGNGGQATRAVDVHADRRVFVGDSQFYNFSNNNDAAMRLAPGARATISNAEFVGNAAKAANGNTTSAAEATGSAVAAGPVMGLYGGGGYSGSAAWLWNCMFTDNSAPVSGEVAVESRSCRVFSNSAELTVWDRQRAAGVGVWPLLHESEAAAAEGMPPDQRGFPLPTDALFERLVKDQAESSNLRPPSFKPFPDASELRTVDPYAAGGAQAGSELAPGVVAGIAGAALLVLTAVVAVVWRHQRLRKKTAQLSTLAPHAEKLQSGLPIANCQSDSSGQVSSALAGQGSWYSRTRSSRLVTDTWGDTRASSLPARAPPGDGASSYELREFVQYQLDTLAGREFLAGLVLQPGPSNRVFGGQAVIQFAKDRRTGLQYAVKFFLSHTAFVDETGLYTNTSTPLGPFLPALRNIVDGTAEAPLLLDGHGHPLPPCIVMEKGESLDMWMQRNRGGVDMITGLQVIQHVAERLSDLHAAGFVHRDLKLSNVMWLPRENRWTLIDFGCAAAIGEIAPLSFSLQYAPPEVLQAMCAGRRTIRAQSSMDAWSLGIIAWELFCNRAALDIFEGKDVAVARILGKKPLPWEAGAAGSKHLLHQLGRFRPAVLGLLQRDAAERLLIPDFITRCRRVIEETRAPPSSNGT